jgi:hypothetical protein
LRVSLAGIPSLKKKHITFQRKRSLLVALLLAGGREQSLIIEEGILHTCGNSYFSPRNTSTSTLSELV